MINMDKLIEYKESQMEEYDEKYKRLVGLIDKFDALGIISSISSYSYLCTVDGIGPISPVLVEYLAGLATNNCYLEKNLATSTDFLDIWKTGDEILLQAGVVNIFSGIDIQDKESEIERNIFAAQLKNNYAFTRGYSWNRYIEKQNIEGIFNGFESEIEKLIGFFPREAFEIIESYQSLMGKRLRNWQDIVSNQSDTINIIERMFSYDFRNVALFSMKDLETECKEVGKQHLNAFFDFFSFNIKVTSNHNYKYPTDQNILFEKPIIQFNNQYLIPNFEMVLWNLRQLIEDEVKKSAKLWNRYDKGHKAKYLEDESKRIVKKLLPQCDIYNSLYYKPAGEETACELDVMAIYDTTIVLVEAKSGIYSTSARRGGLKRLEKDINKNIEYAYNQGSRTKKYIESNEKSIFYSDDKLKNEVISLSKKEIKKIFIINTTLDYYAELGVELYRLKKHGIYKAEEFPWTICISDFKVIADFIDFTNQFLYYLMMRKNLNNSINENSGIRLLYELDILAMYKFEDTELFNEYNCDDFIDTMSLIDLFREPDDVSVPTYICKDYSQYFYKFYYDYYTKGIRPDIPLKLYNERFLTMCRQLEEYNTKGFSNFIYHFLDMDLDDQNKLFSSIDEICEKTYNDHKIHTVTFKEMPQHFCEDKCGMVIYSGYNKDRAKIETNAKKAGYIQQGMTKIKNWIVLCIYLDDNRHFINQFYFYFGNEEIQDELTNIAKRIPIQKGKKLGRNELCLCGSGLKYKKCCGK